jgi:hypothetical protein
MFADVGFSEAWEAGEGVDEIVVEDDEALN